MPIAISKFISGVFSQSVNSLSASELNEVFTKVEEFINGGIITADIDTTTKWVTTEHLVRPEFYGGATPRVLFTTSDVHYRIKSDEITDQFVITNQMIQGATNLPDDHTGLASSYFTNVADEFQKRSTMLIRSTDGSDEDGLYLPIPDLSITAYVDKNQDETGTAYAQIVAIFECFEEPPAKKFEHSGIFDGYPYPKQTGGTNAKSGPTELELENTRSLIGVFRLFVNGNKVDGTARPLFWNYGGAFAHKTHSIVATVELQAGMNDISVRCAPNADSEINTSYNWTYLENKDGTQKINFEFNQIVIGKRNMYVEIIYR